MVMVLSEERVMMGREKEEGGEAEAAKEAIAFNRQLKTVAFKKV